MPGLTYNGITSELRPHIATVLSCSAGIGPLLQIYSFGLENEHFHSSRRCLAFIKINFLDKANGLTNLELFLAPISL